MTNMGTEGGSKNSLPTRRPHYWLAANLLKVRKKSQLVKLNASAIHLDNLELSVERKVRRSQPSFTFQRVRARVDGEDFRNEARGRGNDCMQPSPGSARLARVGGAVLGGREGGRGNRRRGGTCCLKTGEQRRGATSLFTRTLRARPNPPHLTQVKCCIWRHLGRSYSQNRSSFCLRNAG